MATTRSRQPAEVRSTQAILVRLETDILDIFEAAIDGTADRLDIRTRPGASVCVIAASGGYPGKYPSGLPISGLDATLPPDTIIFHSGTALKDGKIVTAGGRVLGATSASSPPVSGPAPSPSSSALQAALGNAYAALEKISFEGMQYRRDIGWRAIHKGL